MDIEARRDRLEKDCKSLIGRKLNAVSYYLVSADGSEAPEHQAAFDELDYGLVLRFEDGDACWITWGSEFYNYSLALAINDEGSREGMVEVDAAATRWRLALGLLITKAAIYWDWDMDRSGLKRWGPRDLILEFDGRMTILVSALQVVDGKFAIPRSDTITVLFDEAVSRHLQVGPHAARSYDRPEGTLAGGLLG